MRFAVWALVAIDPLGVLLLFVLALAAAASSRTSPLQVALVLLVLPCIPLAGSSTHLGALGIAYLRDTPDPAPASSQS